MLTQDLELGVDAIADVMRGSEFSSALMQAHSIQRVVIPYRDLAAVYTDEVESLSGYPACEIVTANSEEEEINVGHQLEHEFSLQFTVNGSDPEVMARETKRLISAARTLYGRGSLLPYVGGFFRTGRADYGPTSGGRTEAYVKSAALQLFWRTIV